MSQPLPISAYAAVITVTRIVQDSQIIRKRLNKPWINRYEQKALSWKLKRSGWCWQSCVQKKKKKTTVDVLKLVQAANSPQRTSQIIACQPSMSASDTHQSKSCQYTSYVSPYAIKPKHGCFGCPTIVIGWKPSGLGGIGLNCKTLCWQDRWARFQELNQSNPAAVQG